MPLMNESGANNVLAAQSRGAAEFPTRISGAKKAADA
jgi:hypothetical protein